MTFIIRAAKEFDLLRFDATGGGGEDLNVNHKLFEMKEYKT
jgi:hypothetical protein